MTVPLRSFPTVEAEHTLSISQMSSNLISHTVLNANPLVENEAIKHLARSNSSFQVKRKTKDKIVESAKNK